MRKKIGSGRPQLTPGEWAVLGLLVAEPAHGFALARELSAEGGLGRVWQVPRPLVYRAVAGLEAAGLVRLERAEDSRLGPRKAIYRATESGREAFIRWLGEPVVHLRETRSELMLKLAFLARREEDPGALLAAQLEAVATIMRGLSARLESARGFERTLTLWRLESARAVVRFVESMERAAAGLEPGGPESRAPGQNV